MPVDWGEKFAWLVEVMKPYYAQKMKYATGVVTRIGEQTNNSGRVNGAYGTIDGDVDQFIDISMYQGLQRNDYCVFVKDENMINPEWRPHKILRSRQPVSMPNPNRKFMPPVVSGADTMIAPGLGGVVAVPDTNPTDDPTGVLQAAAYIHFLAISADQYDAYDYGYTGVKIRYRIVGETDPGTGQQIDWKKEETFTLTPKEVNTVLLKADITNSSTGNVLAAIPDRYLTTLPRNTACWFKIGDEVVLANLISGSDTSINIIARAQLGTSAAAHLTNETFILLSSRLLLENLRPSSAGASIVYQFQLAFVDNFNVAGMWSDTYSFTSYKISAPPATPTNFTVKVVKSGYKLSWTKVPNQHVKQYRVYRYTSNPANGGGDANYASGQSLTGTTLGRIGNVNQMEWPLNEYSPNSSGITAKWFCVVAEDDSGNLSPATAWTTDTTPPDSPDPSKVSIVSTPDGPKIIIDSTDVARQDEGWATYCLHIASNTAGSTPGGFTNPVAKFTDNEFTYKNDPAGLQYYQVTCEDLIGNRGTVVNNGTYWKRDDGIPSSVTPTVTAVTDGFVVNYSPVILTNSTSGVRTVAKYRVYRSNTNGLGGSYTTKVIEGDGFKWSLYDWIPGGSFDQATVWAAEWFAVAVILPNGQETPTGSLVWARDTVAPVSPNAGNVSIRGIDYGVQVLLTESEVTNSKKNPDWKEFVLVYNLTGTGTSYTIAKRFQDHETEYHFNPGETRYFQVLSADPVNNISAANASNWKIVKSAYPIQEQPMNGTFEKATNGASTPDYWGTTTLAPGIKPNGSFSYEMAGGSRGSRCMKVTRVAGNVNPEPAITQTIAIPIDPGRAFKVRMSMAWHLSAGMPMAITGSVVFQFYSDEAGTVNLGTIGFTNNATRNQDQWYTCDFGPYTIGTGSLAAFAVTARSMRIYIGVDQALPTAGDYVLIDNVQLVYTI